MDFTFSDDQIAFRNSISRFLMIEAAPEKLRDVWQTDVGRSPELWGKLAEMGLTALSVPDACGGLGLGDVDWALVTQQLGYFAIPDPLVETACVSTGLLNAWPHDPAWRDGWLARIAAGEARVAIGHPINPCVADAHLAELLLLAHPTPDGTEWHVLEPGAVRPTACASIDASRRLAQFSWEPSASTRRIGAVEGQALADELLDRAALASAGQLIGLAQRMLDLGVDYAAQRKQFGKVIGSFQAVKHHLADVVTLIEFAKPVLYRAAVALAHGEPGRAARVSHAKLCASRAALTAARKSIQVHGAMGYTWEVDLQMFMKRAWALDGAWGDRAFHQARLGDALLDGALAIGPGATFNP